MLYIIYAAFLIIFVLQILAIYYFTRKSIGKPINIIKDKFEFVVQGDLSQQVDNKIIERNDEIGKLGNAINSMLANLKLMASQISDIAGNLSASSEQLYALSEEMSASVEKVSRVIEDVASGTEEQSAQIEETTSSIEELSGKINNVKSKS